MKGARIELCKFLKVQNSVSFSAVSAAPITSTVAVVINSKVAVLYET